MFTTVASPPNRWSTAFDRLTGLLLTLVAATAMLVAVGAIVLGGSIGAALTGGWVSLAWELTLIVAGPAVALAVLAVTGLLQLRPRPAVGRVIAGLVGVLAVGTTATQATEWGGALAATLVGLALTLSAAAAWALEATR